MNGGQPQKKRRTEKELSKMKTEKKFWAVWRNPTLLTHIYSFNKGWRGRCSVFAVLHDDLHTLKWQHDKFFVGIEHAAALLLRRADIYDWLAATYPIGHRTEGVTVEERRPVGVTSACTNTPAPSDDAWRCVSPATRFEDVTWHVQTMALGMSHTFVSSYVLEWYTCWPFYVWGKFAPHKDMRLFVGAHALLDFERTCTGCTGQLLARTMRFDPTSAPAAFAFAARSLMPSLSPPLGCDIFMRRRSGKTVGVAALVVFRALLESKAGRETHSVVVSACERTKKQVLQRVKTLVYKLEDAPYYAFTADESGEGVCTISLKASTGVSARNTITFVPLRRIDLDNLAALRRAVAGKERCTIVYYDDCFYVPAELRTLLLQLRDCAGRIHFGTVPIKRNLKTF